MYGRILFAGVAILVGTAAHAQLADGSFETQGATVTNFCYFTGCPSGTWTGLPATDTYGSGLQVASNPGWPGSIATPNGSHYAFVQTTGALSQTFVADASGPLDVVWLAAGRPADGTGTEVWGGNESYSVTVNGQDLGTFSTTTGQPFSQVTSEPFTFTAGNTYTLSFNGLTPLSTGDNTAYIDGVGLVAPVPEPSTWAMMLLGFGAIGAAMRRRKIQTRFVSP